MDRHLDRREIMRALDRLTIAPAEGAQTRELQHAIAQGTELHARLQEKAQLIETATGDLVAAYKLEARRIARLGRYRRLLIRSLRSLRVPLFLLTLALACAVLLAYLPVVRWVLRIQP